MKKNVSNGMVFEPLFDRVIVKELADQTKYFPVVTKNGVIRPKGVQYSDETDEYTEGFRLVGTAEIIAIGPKCQSVAIGDEIMYDIRCALPIPVKFDVDSEDIPKILTLSEQNIRCTIKKA